MANLWSDEQKSHQARHEGKDAMQSKPNNYTESCLVNVTDRWRERACEYPVRPHGRKEQICEIRLKQALNFSVISCIRPRTGVQFLEPKIRQSTLSGVSSQYLDRISKQRISRKNIALCKTVEEPIRIVINNIGSSTYIQQHICCFFPKTS